MLAVTNTRGSLITREADAVLLTKAGPEICVASTKAFVAQVAVLDLLALELAGIRGVVPGGSVAGGRSWPQAGAREGRGDASRLLGSRVEEAASVFEEARCSLFLGRGISYPVALEGALKLKEISYLPSEGYPAGEMKHGPIALVDEYCPVVAILGEGIVREKTLSNVEETVARGANVIAVAREGDRAAATHGRRCSLRSPRRRRSWPPWWLACRCNSSPTTWPRTAASTWTSHATSPRASRWNKANCGGLEFHNSRTSASQQFSKTT